MSIAERTREAVRKRSSLLDAPRTGAANYRAVATMLDVDANEGAVTAALRRFVDDLPDCEDMKHSMRVCVQRGVGITGVADAEDPLLVVGDRAVAADDGSSTALFGTGDVDARALARALRVLDADPP